MRLSIIIPVYNVEKYIKKCIFSCINQVGVSLDDYEIIIVNDGTKDNSMVIVKDIIDSLENRNNITIITQKNMGLSEARNTGLRHAKGDYVWFVDSDDWIDEDSVENIISKLRIGNIDILQMPFKWIYEDGRQTQYECIKEISEPISGQECMKITRFPNLTQSRVYSRSYLNNKKLHFTPGILHEDAEFKPRSIWMAHSIITLNKPCYNYLKRDNNSITSSFSIRNAIGRWVGIKSMYSFTNEFCFKDKLLFNDDINFNMVWILATIPKLNNKDRDQIISEISQSRKVFKRMLWTLSPKKFITYLALYLNPQIFLKLYYKYIKFY